MIVERGAACSRPSSSRPVGGHVAIDLARIVGAPAVGIKPIGPAGCARARGEQGFAGARRRPLDLTEVPGAVVPAGVVVVLVAVVAGFDPSLDLPITAGRCGAVVQAGVGLHLVAVIARFFASVDLSIAAQRDGAIVEAGVRLDLVAIVATFNVFVDEAVTRMMRPCSCSSASVCTSLASSQPSTPSCTSPSPQLAAARSC